ncbi:hypothetical protein SLEP1_g14720 [Rubroshorea leprosula]|uniref:Uncharacterized protein n=1 Tax=Rubroshorea leprosula TaxID=152421 RepID=A0AAV5IVG8_9ROSI|nr:hypothetical protein SLEP1_g14720 [Rubroshorea leprosula]
MYSRETSNKITVHLKIALGVVLMASMRELVLKVLADLQEGFIREWHNQRSAQLTLFEILKRAFWLPSTHGQGIYQLIQCVRGEEKQVCCSTGSISCNICLHFGA